MFKNPLFSDRTAAPDSTLQYSLSQQARTAIAHATIQLFADSDYRPYASTSHISQEVVRKLKLAHGRMTLAKVGAVKKIGLPELMEYLFSTEVSIEEFLDTVELCFQECSTRANLVFPSWAPDEEKYVFLFAKACSELSYVLERFSLGYRWHGLQFHRIDSEVTESTIIQPALTLLYGKEFAVPNAEYQEALNHERNGRGDEACVFAIRAVESVLKIIGVSRGWNAPEKKAAKALLDLAFSEALIPAEMQTSFGGLRSLLEAGAPPIRNVSGHGKGGTKHPLKMPAHLVAFTLANAASAIILLVKLHQNT